MVDDEVVCLDRLSIKARTALLAARKMKPPSAEKAWEERLGFEIDWNKVWRIKSFYASPRDQFTWLCIGTCTQWGTERTCRTFRAEHAMRRNHNCT